MYFPILMVLPTPGISCLFCMVFTSDVLCGLSSVDPAEGHGRSPKELAPMTLLVARVEHV